MTKKLTLVALSVLAMFCAHVSCQEAVKQLRNNLFKEYDSKSRPIKHHSNMTQVCTGLFVLQIVNLNSKSQTLQANIQLVLFWNDSFLTWVPEEHDDIKKLPLKSSTVWTPDIVIMDSIEEKMYRDNRDNYQLILYANGTIRWQFQTLTKIFCQINMMDFPFDEQVCSLSVRSTARDKNLIKMIRRNDKIKLKENIKTEWYIRESKVIEETMTLPQSQREFSVVRFEMRLRRRTLFYFLKILFPFSLIALITLFTFWLAPDSGEKLTLDVTILLSLVFYLQMASDYIPRGYSKIPLLTLFTLTNFSLVFLSCALTVFILRLYYMTPSLISSSNYQIPYRLRVFLFKYMARIVCLRFHFRDKDTKLTHRPSNFGRDVLTSSDFKAVRSRIEKIYNKRQSTVVVNEILEEPLDKCGPLTNHVSNLNIFLESINFLESDRRASKTTEHRLLDLNKNIVHLKKYSTDLARKNSRPMIEQTESHLTHAAATCPNFPRLSALATTPSEDSLVASLKVGDFSRFEQQQQQQQQSAEKRAEAEEDKELMAVSKSIGANLKRNHLNERLNMEDMEKRKYLNNLTNLHANLKSLGRFIRKSIRGNQNHKFDRKGQLIEGANGSDDSNSNDDDDYDSESIDICMCDGDLMRAESLPDRLSAAKKRAKPGSSKHLKRAKVVDDYGRKMRPLTLEEKLVYYQEWKQAALILDRMFFFIFLICMPMTCLGIFRTNFIEHLLEEPEISNRNMTNLCH